MDFRDLQICFKPYDAKISTISPLATSHRYADVERTGSEDHQLPSVGAVVLAVPWVLHYAALNADDCARRTVEAVSLTHPAPSLMPYIDLYARTLHGVLHGAPLKDQVLKALSSPLLGGERKRKSIEKLSQQAAK